MVKTVRMMLLAVALLLPWNSWSQCGAGVPTVTMAVECYDSFGDGWNGCALAVYQGGEQRSWVTFTSGHYAEVIVEVCLSTDSVYFVWMPGNWESEVSYVIRNADDINTVSGTGVGHASGDTVAVLYPHAPTCGMPIHLSATAIGETTATLQWESSYGDVMSYRVRVISPTGEVVQTHTAVSGTSLNLTGLSSGTHYTVAVSATCDGTQYTRETSAEFSTLCGSLSLPFTETWDSLYNDNPWENCWYYTGTNTNNLPYLMTTTGHYGDFSRMLVLWSDGDTGMLVSSAVPLPGNAISVSFLANLNGGLWEAGVVTDPNDISTFIPLLSNDNFCCGWHEYHFNTSTLDPTATYYVAWKLIYSNSYISVYLDDIEIRQYDGCEYPRFGWLEYNSYYEAQVRWTAVTGVDSYSVYYGTDPTGASVDSLTVNDTMAFFDNLAPGVSYYVWVKPPCGTRRCFVASFTTATSCYPLLMATTQDVGTAAARINWATHEGYGYPSVGVQLTLTDLDDSTATPTVIYTTGSQYLFTQLMPDRRYEVQVANICDVSDYQRTDTSTTVSTSFTTASCGGCSGVPTCASPMPSISFVTSGVPMMHWPRLGEESGYAIAQRTSEDTVWTLVGTTADTSYIFGSLAPATRYQLRVGSLCGDDTLWGSTFSFSTPCGTMQLPWSDGFEANELYEQPLCWNSVLTTEKYGTTYPRVDGQYVNDSTTNKTLTFSGVGTNLLVSNAIPLRGDSIKAVFRASFSGNWNSAAYGVMTDPYDINTFVTKGYINDYNWLTYMMNTADLDSATTYYLAFFTSFPETWNYLSIDDVRIMADDGCRGIDYNSINYDSTHAQIILYPFGNHTDYIVRYWENGYILQPEITGSTDSSYVEVALDGLIPNTYYTYSIASICGSDTLWINNMGFYTTGTCPQISGLHVVDSSFNSVTVAWNRNEDNPYNQYRIHIGDLLHYINDTVFTISGLSDGTEYTVGVSAYCDNVGTWSEFYNIIFTTPAFPTIEQYPYFTTFDNDAERQSWIIYNGTNGWYADTLTSALSSSHTALYVSHNGSTNQYNPNTNSISYAVRNLNISEAGNYLVAFRWQAQGENRYDYLRAWLAPSEATFNAGLLPNGSTSSYNYAYSTPDGWIDLGGMMNLSGWTVNESLQHLETGHYKLVFMWANDGSAGSQPPAAIDSLWIVKYTCPSVDVVHATTLDPHSALLSWTDSHRDANTIYNVILGTEVIASNLTDTTYTLQGLDEHTEYTVRIERRCSPTDAAYPTDVTFTTPCELITRGYRTGFEVAEIDPLTQLPYCWSKYNNVGSSYPYVTSYNGRNNSHSLYFYTSNSSDYADTIMVILPEVDIQTQPMTGAQLVFFTRLSNNDSTILQVGTMSNPDDPATFTADSTLVITDGSEQEHMVPLAVHSPATNAWPAIMLLKGENSNSLYLDDIMYDVIPSCERPANPQIYQVWADSAIISLDYNGAESWEIELTSADTVVYFTIPATAVTQRPDGSYTYTISPLQPYTYYSMRTRSFCGGGNSYWTLYSSEFTTLNDESNILALDMPYLSRGATEIDTAALTVTLPIYYSTNMTEEEGTYTLSDGATLQVLDDAGVWIDAPRMRTLLHYAYPNVPLYVRVIAQDNNYSSQWTLLFVSEACTRINNVSTRAERTALDFYWDETDPAVNTFDLVFSPIPLSSDQLDTAYFTQNSKHYRVEGLERETTYYLYIRAVCMAGRSAWTKVEATTASLTHCEELVVGDTLSTQTSYHTPLNNFYNFTLTQTIVTHDDLQGMLTIEAISFYYDYLFPSTLKNNGRIYLQPTDKNYFTSSDDMEPLASSAVLVYDGSLNMQPGWNRIEFDTPYQYDSTHNLLLIVDDNGGGYNGSAYVFRVSPTEQPTTIEWYSDSYDPDPNNLSLYNSSKGSYSYRALMQFDGCFVRPACIAPADLAIDSIGSDAVVVSWSTPDNDYLHHYEYSLDTLHWTSLQNTEVLLTNLVPYTDYTFYLRSNCETDDHDDGVSDWIYVSFRTAPECRSVENLTADIIGKQQVRLTWSAGGADIGQTSNFEYVLSTAELTETQLATAPVRASGLHDTACTFSALLNDQTYYFYVRNQCPVGNSPWESTSFTTYLAMPPVVDLHTEAVSYNALTVGWQRDDAHFADETMWIVDLYSQLAVMASDTVGEMRATFFGLTPTTDYRVSVRAYKPVTGATSDTVALDVRTSEPPTDCERIAEGNNNNQYVPLYGYYTDNHQRIQSIYPASMLSYLNGRTITSLRYAVNSGSSSNWDTAIFRVYLGVTSQDNLADGWADTSMLTLVYTGTLSASVDQGMNILLDQPFTYDGGNLLVQFVLRKSTGYSSCYFLGSYAQSASRYAYPSNSIDLMSDGGILQDFLPQVDFCCVELTSCYPVREVLFDNITTHSADVMWYPGGEESVWDWKVESGASIVDSGQWSVASGEWATLGGLNADRDYTLYIRPVCSSNDYGVWSLFHFTTAPSCLRPDSVWTTAVTDHGATLHTINYQIPTGNTFRYWPEYSNDTMTVSSTTDSVTLTGLLANTTYYFEARTDCGSDGMSRWSPMGIFHTLCGGEPLPYEHHFSWDNSCWTFVSTNGSSNITEGGFCFGGGVRFNTANVAQAATSYQYAFSPRLDSDTTTPRKVTIEFSSNTENDRLWIGYTMDEESMNPEDYVWSNSSYSSDCECCLGYGQLFLPAGVKRVAIRYHGNRSSFAILYYLTITEPMSYQLSVDYDTTVASMTLAVGNNNTVVSTEQSPLTTTLYEASDITLTAVPKRGYSFYNWTMLWSSGVVSTDNPYNFILNGGTHLVANFIINKYNVTAVSSNTTMGSVYGGGRVDYLTPMTLIASANYGYHFTGWSNGDEGTATTLLADSNITLVAYFDYNRYAIVGSSADETMGSVSGSDTVNYLSEVTLEAEPNYGYHFVAWSNGDTNRQVVVQAVENRMLTANFSHNQYAVVGVASDATMGTVAGSATVNYLSSVTLTATAAYGYHFSHWSNGATTTSISVPALCDTMLTAHFERNSYTVVTTSADTAMGVTWGDTTALYLDSITLTATAHYGYHFTGWSNGATANPLQLQLTSDIALTANFAPNQYTVNAIVDYPGRGSVSGSATVNYLTPVTLSAAPFYGYRFVGWALDANNYPLLTTNPQITLIADSNRTVVAIFDTIVYNVTALVNNSTMGSVSGADSTRHFSSATLTATANYGYHFVSWTNTVGNVLGVGTSLSVSPVSDTLVVANFAPNQYTVSGSADATMGTVTGTSTVDYLTDVTLTAIAGNCYHFTHWSTGDTTASITLAAERDTAVTAYFALNVYEGTETVTACDSYLWNGQTYTSSGSYTFNTLTALSCDSTATLSLTIHYSGTSSFSEVVCDSFLWRGNLYTTSGAYTFDTLTTLGCDSLITLNLTVHNSTTGTDMQTACDSYTWIDGTTYTASNSNVQLTIPNAHGCDSTVTLNLTIHYSDLTGTESLVACDSLLWNGQTYTSSGVYTYDTQTIYGCDSTATLTLTVHQSTLTTIDTVVDISFSYADSVYTESTVIVLHHATVEGCDSTVVINLTVIPYYTVTLVADSTMGTVDGAGFYAAGSEVIITATPLVHRHFVEWSDGVTENTRTLTIQSDTLLTALFDYDSVTIILAVDDESMGTVDPLPGSYVYHVGDLVTVTATPDSGFSFAHWTLDTTLYPLPTDNYQLTFEITPEMAGGTLVLTAVFEPEVGIEPIIPQVDAIVTVIGRRIVVTGISNTNHHTPLPVDIYDVTGRRLHHQTSGTDHMEFTVPSAGVYLVHIGNSAARRVVVQQ